MCHGWFVAAHMSGFDQGGADVVGGHFVEHALHQAFDRVFGGAVGAQTGDTEGTACGAEDQIAAAVSTAFIIAVVLLFRIASVETAVAVAIAIAIAIPFPIIDLPPPLLVSRSKVWEAQL